MQYRQLGSSGLRVSVLSFGTATFGGTGSYEMLGNTNVTEARRQLDLCLDAGLNLVDTADAYSDGLAERFLGAAMEGRRDRLLIATKARFATGAGVNDAGLSRHHLLRACDASLKRLRVDHIDLYQMHEWDGQTPVEETIEALDGLVQAGKVRYIGCSNFAGWQLMKSLGVSERLGLQRYVCQQIHYSLAARDAEHELIPTALDQGLGTLVWSPLAGGLLSGKYRRDRQPADAARILAGWDEPPIRDYERLWAIIDGLVDIAAAHDVPAAAVALAWLIGRPGVTSAIIGARTEQQLTQNLQAVVLELTERDRAALDALSGVPLPYPHWHQAKLASDRLGEPELSLLAPHLAP